MSGYPMTIDDVSALSRLIGGDIGNYDNGVFVPHPSVAAQVDSILSNPLWKNNAPSEPVPNEIEVRKLLIGLRMVGFITPEEEAAWARRQALPAKLMEVIEQLPPEAQASAITTAFTMTAAQRNNPLIAMAAALMLPDASPEERNKARDEYFIAWNKI